MQSDYFLVCDACGAKARAGRSLDEAQRKAVDAGWESRFIFAGAGKWSPITYCKECALRARWVKNPLAVNEFLAKPPADSVPAPAPSEERRAAV
jgi:hypothetical protein